MYLQGNMTGNTKTMRVGIIEMVTLVLRTIAEKNEHGRMGRKFGSLNGRQKDETSTTESVKITISGSMRGKMLIRSDAKRSGGRSSVDEIDGGKNGFNLEGLRDKRSQMKCMGSVQDVMMLTISDIILNRCIRTGLLRNIVVTRE